MAYRGLNTPLLEEKVSPGCKRMVRSEERTRAIRAVEITVSYLSANRSMANGFKDHRKSCVSTRDNRLSHSFTRSDR